MLKEIIEKRKLNYWDLDFEYVDVIYKLILESETYKEYMSKGASDLKEDKDFMIDIYSEIIAPNEKLSDYLEDKQITWVDDLPVVNTAIVKVFQNHFWNLPRRHFRQYTSHLIGLVF